jgi:hypothetical protein
MATIRRYPKGHSTGRQMNTKPALSYEPPAMRAASGAGRRYADAHEEPCRAEVLLRSACRMLRDKPPDLVAAMTLSLPVDAEHTTYELLEMARELADEHGLSAQSAIGERHVNVRLLRRSGERR